MTHEFIATMLGTRRSGITVLAGALRAAGLIEYSRGHLRLVDRSGMENSACECYCIVRDYYDRYISTLKNTT